MNVDVPFPFVCLLNAHCSSFKLVKTKNKMIQERDENKKAHTSMVEEALDESSDSDEEMEAAARYFYTSIP